MCHLGFKCVNKHRKYIEMHANTVSNKRLQPWSWLKMTHFILLLPKWIIIKSLMEVSSTNLRHFGIHAQTFLIDMTLTSRGCYGVANPRQLNCLISGLFMLTLQKTSKWPGHYLTTAIWRFHNYFSQWQRSFQRKLRSHWLKCLRQYHVAVAKQGAMTGSFPSQCPIGKCFDVMTSS